MASKGRPRECAIRAAAQK